MFFIELLFSIIGMAFGVFLFVGAQHFPPTAPHPGVPGARFFPNIISIIIFGLSLVILVFTLAKRKKMRIPDENKPGKEEVQFARKQALRIVGIVVLALIYALLWSLNMGHFVVNSIVIFIPITMLFGGAQERQWWKTSIYIVFLIVFVYVLFKHVLRVAI